MRMERWCVGEREGLLFLKILEEGVCLYEAYGMSPFILT